jgi:hypothetical protein
VRSLRRTRQDRVNIGRIGREAEPLRRGGITKHAGDAGQSLKMVGAGAFWRKQQKDQVDGLVVQRIEVHRPGQSRENTGELVQRLQLAVRDRDAVTDAGRAQPLALQDGVEDLALRRAVSPAAVSQTSCRTCFFDCACSEGRTASGFRRSLRSI